MMNTHERNQNFRSKKKGRSSYQWNKFKTNKKRDTKKITVMSPQKKHEEAIKIGKKIIRQEIGTGMKETKRVCACERVSIIKIISIFEQKKKE